MYPSVSVVCASIGRASLASLIPSLKASPCVAEIIVVLPPHVLPSTDLLDLSKSSSHVYIVNSFSKGQVNQRVFGVRFASNPYIMFIDDDIFIDSNVVDLLLTRLLDLPLASVVAPVINQYLCTPSVVIRSKGYLSRFVDILERLLSPFSDSYPYYLSYFSRPTLFTSKPQRMTPSSWLPGGCLMMSSLVAPKESYYSFSGKAFAEDIYLSSFLLDSGASLYLAQDLNCFTQFDHSAGDFKLQLFVRLAIHRLSRSRTLLQVLHFLFLLPLFFMISFSLVVFVKLVRHRCLNNFV